MTTKTLGNGANALGTSTGVLDADFTYDDQGGVTLRVTYANVRKYVKKPNVQVVPTGVAVTPTALNDIVSMISTQSAGTLTINAVTGTPVDGQQLILRFNTLHQQTYAFD